VLLVSEPSVGNGEKLALAEVIDSNWITMGGQVEAFEHAFAAQHQAADAVAVNSCTAGLHLALQALGVGAGDEVLVPSLSFVATANCALYCGATPVFVDVTSVDVPLIDLEDAARKLSPRTRAVIVMHYAGYMVEPDAWRQFAERHGLFLIEDSAHAVGPGRGPVFGDAAVFSFYGNKNMTTAEGGMVIAADPDLQERIRRARGHGMTSGTAERLHSRTPTYDVTMLGFNYRMTELNAAIGLVQLDSLPAWNHRRASLTRDYRRHLSRRCPAVSMPFPEPRPSTYHILPALLPASADRAMVMARMRDAGIQTTFHYPPIHHLSYYRERYPTIRLPHTETFAARQLTLPLHPKLTELQVEQVVGSLAAALLP
jgi:dTDP-4-amino-4,6-dideoxygalactose transaminase